MMFHGEMTLRTISSLAEAHPLVPLVRADPSGVRELRRQLQQADDLRLGVALGYIDAIADVVDRIRGVAVSGPSLADGWQPIADGVVGELAKRFGFPSVELEMGVAIDHQLKTEAIPPPRRHGWRGSRDATQRSIWWATS